MSSKNAWGAAAGALGVGLLQYGQRRNELDFEREREENLRRIQDMQLQETRAARVEQNNIAREGLAAQKEHNAGMREIGQTQADASVRSADASVAQAEAAKTQAANQGAYWAGQVEALKAEDRRELAKMGILRFGEDGKPIIDQALVEAISKIEASKSPYAGLSAQLGANARVYDTDLTALQSELKTLLEIDANDYVGTSKAAVERKARIKFLQGELDSRRSQGTSGGAGVVPPPLLTNPRTGAPNPAAATGLPGLADYPFVNPR